MSNSIHQIWHNLKQNPFDAVMMLLIALVGLWSGIQTGVIIADDAMITYRVAENLAFGRGFVYNPGEYVQVTTTPLYAIVLAAGVWIFGAAPVAALVLNIALAALNPVLAFDVGRRLAGRITGLCGALLLTFAPLLVIAFSMESYLYVFLILAGMDAYTARRYGLTGVVLGITGLLRGDAVLMGASMLMFDTLAHRRFRWRLIVPAILLPALWLLFATFYYGSPFPATLQAKTAQGELNWLGEYFISGFIEYWEDWLEVGNNWFYLFPLLYLIGLIPVFWRERTWLVLIGRDVLYVIGFELLGVTFAEWYYAPLMPGIALIIGRGIQFLADGITSLLPVKVGAGQTGRTALKVGVATLLLTLLLQNIIPITAAVIADNPDWKALTYPQAARWIARNTNANATLATIDIGHLGYWSGRHIVDIVGLAQPDVAPAIAQGDFGYAIRQYRPDMVLLGALWLPEIQSADWFLHDYPARHTLRLEGMAEPMTLFSRREGVRVNTEALPATHIRPLAVDFNRQIKLAGYYTNQPVKAGQTLHLTLFWESLAPVELDFTVFAQLVDADNNIIGQGDGKPQHGFYPTPFWQPGETIVDLHSIPIEANTLPGMYNLIVGLYDNNGNRLQILDDSGEFISDHIRLPDIELAPES